MKLENWELPRESHSAFSLVQDLLLFGNEFLNESKSLQQLLIMDLSTGELEY